ncbi:hypothetical protein UQW22_06200 [Isoptericola halotolerans]
MPRAAVSGLLAASPAGAVAAGPAAAEEQPAADTEIVAAGGLWELTAG